VAGKIALFVLLVLAVTVSPAEAQQPKKVPRIGYLSTGDPATESARAEPIRGALRELGYIEGQNIAIDYRFAEGNLDRLPDLAVELVRLSVDVIVAVGGAPVILAAKNATSTIPIVFPTVGDPVALGIVDSLARPGGNITGLTLRTPELSGKRLELLKEVVPNGKRVAVLGEEANPSHTIDFRSMQAVATALGLELHQMEVRSPNNFESAFSKITKLVRASALFIQDAPIFIDNRKRLADLAIKGRLPAVYGSREVAEAGVLMSYGSDRFDLGRRAAIYVDKILKGSKPGDLPVEQPTKFEFIINLKTAKQIGITIPQSVLYRADKVIK